MSPFTDMSIFTTPTSRMRFGDVQELLPERAVENARLEFKRNVPDKDETLKKLSSFANTLGGLLVVGAEAGNDGRITGLPGVPVQSIYKQTLVQWCFGGVTPPLDFEVSEPIPTGAASGNVFYLVADARDRPAASHENQSATPAAPRPRTRVPRLR